MSVQEQIDTFSRTKVVIGQYGSGLTNVIGSDMMFIYTFFNLLFQ